MGYFASIARQSGLRFSGKDGRARRAGESRTASPAPLDREETVMAHPSVETPIARHGHGEGEISDTGAAPERSPVSAAQEAPLVSADKTPSMLSPAKKKPHKEGTTSPGQNSVSKGYDAAPHEIKKTVFVGQPKDESATESKSDTEVKISATTESKFSTEGKISAANEPPDKSPGKSYFAQTAEMIAGRKAEPAEVQTVLFRETQEWIAAGPEPEAGTPEKTFEPSREAMETEGIVQMIKPEPGVVRIGSKRRTEPDVDVSIQQSSGIEEQSFELSIGTISVVIEGDDGPQQPAEIKRPERSAQNTSEEMRRGSSRLSRHYI